MKENGYLPPEVMASIERKNNQEFLIKTLIDQGYAFLQNPNLPDHEMLVIYKQTDDVNMDGAMQRKKALSSQTLDLFEKYTDEGQDYYLPIGNCGWLVTDQNGEPTLDFNRTYRISHNQQIIDLPVVSEQRVKMAAVAYHSYDGIFLESSTDYGPQLEAIIKSEASEPILDIPVPTLLKIKTELETKEEKWRQKSLATLLMGTSFLIAQKSGVKKVDTDALFLSDKGKSLVTALGVKPKSGQQNLAELDWSKIEKNISLYNLSEAQQKTRIVDEKNQLALKKKSMIEENDRINETYWKNYLQENNMALLGEENKPEDEGSLKNENEFEDEGENKKSFWGKLRRFFMGKD